MVLPSEDVVVEKVEWGAFVYAVDGDGVTRGIIRRVRKVNRRTNKLEADLCFVGYEKTSFWYDWEDLFCTRPEAEAYFKQQMK